jgi:hypothetical protein
VPYEVQSRIREAFPDLFEERLTREVEKIQARIIRRDRQRLDDYEHPEPPPAVIAVDGLISGHRATVEGRVCAVDEKISHGKTIRVVTIGDASGELRVKFGPGHGGTEIQPGQLLRLTGKAQQSGNRPVYMADPSYHIIEEPEKTAAGD